MLKRRYLVEYWRYEPETWPEHCRHQRGRRQKVVLCVAARVASVQSKMMFESSSHPTHLFFKYVSFDEHAVVYTQNTLSRDIYSIQYDMSDLDTRHWRHGVARSARQCTFTDLRSLSLRKYELILNIAPFLDRYTDCIGGWIVCFNHYDQFSTGNGTQTVQRMGFFWGQNEDYERI